MGSGGLPGVALGSGGGESVPLVLPLVLPRLGTDSKALLLAALLILSGRSPGVTLGKAWGVAGESVMTRVIGQGLPFTDPLKGARLPFDGCAKGAWLV